MAPETAPTGGGPTGAESSPGKKVELSIAGRGETLRLGLGGSVIHKEGPTPDLKLSIHLDRTTRVGEAIIEEHTAEDAPVQEGTETTEAGTATPWDEERLVY